MGADGGAPPEGEGNPAEGGCFASIYDTHKLKAIICKSYIMYA